MNNSNGTVLDKMKLNMSAENFKEKFNQMVQLEKQKSIHFINHSELKFSTFFLLIEEIEYSEIFPRMNYRNRIAIKIIHSIQQRLYAHEINYIASDKKIIQVFLWMFKTGYLENEMQEDYDVVIDGVASLLIQKFHYKGIFHELAELIFKRNREGRYIHDLVWIIFHSKDIKILRILGKYLKSEHVKDRTLASKLLRYDMTKIQTKDSSYEEWLSQNKQYIYFTGESLQLASEPRFYRVNLEAKYLNKKVSHANGRTINSLSLYEKDNCEKIKNITCVDMELISRYSVILHDKNIYSWRKWMGYELKEQIEIAKKDLGGVI
ncbi:MAG: hypothetical protein ACOWWH_13375 [Eubacteriaceae bacterium]